MEKTEKFIKTLFDRISARYDLFNTASSFFLDRYWRHAASALLEKKDARVLDVCTGTGELAFQLSKRLNGGGRGIGIDFSEKMLFLAKEKVAGRRIKNVSFLLGKAEALSFPDALFDCVTSGFSMRNLMSLEKGLQEMFRVLKKGGRLVILEINRPSNRLTGFLYRLYLRGIVPVVGFLTCGTFYPFLYLNQSVVGFLKPEEFCEKLRAAGFRDISYRGLAPGVIGLYDAFK